MEEQSKPLQVSKDFISQYERQEALDAKRLEKESSAQKEATPPDVSDGAAAAAPPPPPAAAPEAAPAAPEDNASLAAASLASLQSSEATVEMLQAQLEHLTVKVEAIEGPAQPGVRKEDVEKVARKELQDVLKEVNASSVGLRQCRWRSAASETW